MASLHPGSFEIYRIEKLDPLQFISESSGQFQQTISLPAGQYLIMADCSSKIIDIEAGETQRLTAHHVHFKAPSPPRPQDKFLIQCERYKETQSRQSFTGRYQLNVLSGAHDFLVGMIPTRPDPELLGAKEPGEIFYPLASIEVAAFQGQSPETSYFVSPVDDVLAITENQVFGAKQYLLPGSYRVEANGTIQYVTLKAMQEHVIEPAFLEVTTPKGIDLEASQKIRGTPLFAELNFDHHIDLNELIPVMPGQIHVRLSDSKEQKVIHLEEKESIKIKAKSVVVRSDCAPWDWTCLGRIQVYLYEKSKPYPIAQGVTDVPLLYFADNVSLSLQGTKDIHRVLDSSRSTTTLTMGRIQLSPQWVFRNGFYTDLVRVETTTKEFFGQSLDINLTTEESWPLLTGSYQLATYVSPTKGESERQKKTKSFIIRPHQSTSLTYQVVSSDEAQVEERTPSPFSKGSEEQVMAHPFLDRGFL